MKESTTQISRRARPAPGHARRAVAVAATVLSVGAMLGATSTSASGTTPGVNGRISFMRIDDGGHWQVWTANPDLTAQQREVVRLLAEGLTDEGISRRIGVSLRTVRRIASELMVRLTARSRFEAGVKAARSGWIE